MYCFLLISQKFSEYFLISQLIFNIFHFLSNSPMWHEHTLGSLTARLGADFHELTLHGACQCHEEISHPPTLLGILDDDGKLGEPFHRQPIDADDNERHEFEGEEMPGENRQGMLAHEIKYLGTNTLRVFHPLKERVESPCSKCRCDDIRDESPVAIRILVHRHVPDKRAEECHRQCQSNLPVVEWLHLILRQSMTDDNQQSSSKSLRRNFNVRNMPARLVEHRADTYKNRPPPNSGCFTYRIIGHAMSDPKKSAFINQ